ncbi:carboxypeptidase-like regulatory domain-containing protein [Muricauda sp. CAU 1633]|uniref:TonB-dependent receptor n=1 Tax=Allomuricauda sp. CAU 1633 TaxID=2816036 RepID=UPI001A8DF6BA|nr:carboxypeptidase-like regulatory domain-containing protein [Muricauda sp. CAU 1633]MBO0323072.1 carboxypeptidase-like regulatory domain-containing protein [Muricauda sp. CAU 1633]
MRNRVAFIILLLSVHCGFAQNEVPRVSLSFTNATLEEVFQDIEAQTDLQFFYLQDWVSEKRVSGVFDKVLVTTVLDDLLKQTVINYFIMEDGRVFLLQNTQVYASLPDNFFGERNQQLPEEETSDEDLGSVGPVFVQTDQNTVRTMETVRIGRATRGNDRRVFTLQGQAVNQASNQPIPDLAILVEGEDMGTSTDSNGNYSLRLSAGEHIIQTRGLGIQDSRTRVILYGDGTHNFQLNESVESLDEVVVEGNRNRNVEAVTTGVTVIDVEGIKNIPQVLGERDILKAAVALPGITTAGEGASGFNVRGGRTDQNLILLDNGVVYNPAHFFGIFSTINPFTTGSAEIYKGDMPAEFGGRLSSVFDISSKDANTEKFSGEASIGPVTANVVLETPIIKNKSALMVGGRGTYSDWILGALDDKRLSNSSASFYDVMAKYNHTINQNNEIKATGYYSYDDFSITSDSIYNYSNRLFSLGWDHKFSDKTTSNLILSNSEYQFGIEFDGQANDDFDLGYKNNETEIKYKMKYLYNDKHTLDFGFASKYYVVNPGRKDPIGPDSDVSPLTIPKEQGLESALFISDQYEVSDKLLLGLGLRYSFYAALGEAEQRIYQDNAPRNEETLEETQQFGKNEIIETYGGPELRLSARYFILPDFSVKASLNNAYQYIHTLSNNTTVSPTDIWKLSDINIKPQEAYQATLGFYKNFDGSIYELSLEGYYKKQKNLLDYKVGAELLLNETIEAEVLQGDGKAYGVEFLIRKNEGRLNGWLGYTYSRSFVKLDSEFNEERINNGEFFPSNYDKPHDISLVANYKFTRRFSASANFVYQTGRPVTFPIGSFSLGNSEYVFYSDRNKFRIPDYYRLDLSFQMEGNHKIKKFAHSFWSFSIYNVLGRNNPYSVFFVTEDGDIKAYQSSIFSIPVPTITYNFKF